MPFHGHKFDLSEIVDKENNEKEKITSFYDHDWNVSECLTKKAGNLHPVTI